MTDNKQDKNAQNNIEKDVVVAETAEQNNTENNVVETVATENNNIENAAGQNDEIQATAGDSVSEENADSQEEEQVKESKKSTAEAILEEHGGWVKYNSEDGAFTSEFLVPAIE